MQTYFMTPSQKNNPCGTHGAVTSPHYLASQAGMHILRKGGTAIDAAIAMVSTLSVVYPHMCSIGGDAFWLIYTADDKKVRALNASGRAGERATIDFYKNKGFTQIPMRGYLAANTVPGAVAGWKDAFALSQEALQSQMSWEELLADAIIYAEKGFSVTHSLAHWLDMNTNTTDTEYRNLQRFVGFQSTFIKSDSTPYTTGDILKQPVLAQTLHTLAVEGADSFYTGSIARKILADLEANDALITAKDYATHTSTWVEPLSVLYRGYKAYNFPPNSQGMASLAIINILQNYDIQALQGSADYYHLLVEATKEAFLDRDAYVTDPAHFTAPVEQLLSQEHGKKQAARIDMQKAATYRTLLDPYGDTVWLGAVDEKGNAVSLIQSIYHDFGSGILPQGTGVTLQNRGSYFSLDAKHINALQPGKRTFHTLNPAIITKDTALHLVYGTMGGEGQPQTQAALVTRILDFGLTPQEAIDAPRWLYGRTWGEEVNDLKLEGRISLAIQEELAQRGHTVTRLADYAEIVGHAGAILLKGNCIQAGTDPRSDGLALAY